MNGADIEIRWDSNLVPHLLATSDQDLFYGFGWAQARNHGNLLLRLYGQARGKAAEYWGAEYLDSDRWLHRMDLPCRSRRWHDTQRKSFQAKLAAFADGVNAYVHEHPDLIDPSLLTVLPVSAVDVLAHCQRVVNLTFSLDSTRLLELVSTRLSKSHPSLGSNAWAIGPSRSKSGNAMLLANPHLPWTDMYRLFEAHLTTSDVNLYGVTLVGFPVPIMGFNDSLGWAHTVNRFPGWTLYELELHPDGYYFEGQAVPFQVHETVLNVLQPDGSLQTETIVVRNSIHGPVISAKDGKAYALRIAGLDKPRALEQWWRMATATDRSEFESALAELQIPLFNVLYADCAGDILYVFNGSIPVHSDHTTSDSSNIACGDTSSTLWVDTHHYEDLPRLLNPITGWLQNANDPPWTVTWPAELDGSDYPSYITLPCSVSLRAQRSIRMLMESDKLSLDEIIESKYSTRMELADRLLNHLLAAVIESGNEMAGQASAILESWDRCADPDSCGAVLFVCWLRCMTWEQLFANPWNSNEPLDSPSALADPHRAVLMLEEAASIVKSTYGRLDIPWGEVCRVSHEAYDRITEVPDEQLGIFPELWFAKSEQSRFDAIGGDGYTLVAEFSKPVQAKALLIYGNASQPHLSQERGQFDLYRRKQLRPVLLSSQEIRKDTVRYDVLNYSPSVF
ncbi:MAG: penicillin acylase family protein [Pseudomonadota bacterium]